MIEKLNIKIENKDTKKIYYKLHLDERYWRKEEYDSRGNEVYYEDSSGDWFKEEYDNEGKRVYYESSRGYIIDDR
jgi:hypothetical protein